MSDGYDWMMDDQTEGCLHANAPNVTSVAFRKSYRVHYPLAHDLERMVKALGQSTHVTKVFIELNCFDTIVMGGLIQGSKGDESLKQLFIWIKSNAKLDTVHLNTYYYSRETASLLLPAFIAAMCSRHLNSVSLNGLDVEADDLVKLFGELDLKEFSMKGCEIRQGSFATEELAARQVAKSLAAMQALSTLELGVTDWNQAYFVAILERIQSHTSIETLKFCNDRCDMLAVNAIANLLQKATKEGLWKELHFEEFVWTDATMGTIARSIGASSMNLQELYFYRGGMDNASMVHLQSLISPDSFMGKVWFKGPMFAPCNSDDNVTPDTLEAFVSTSGLSDIGLPSFGNDEQGKKLFGAVLRGLKAASCGIRKVYFLDDLYDVNVPALVDAIPYFTNVTHIYFENGFGEHRGKLLNAFCRNRKLVASNLELYDEFDESQHARLEVYMERNRSLGPTIQSTIKSMDVLEHDKKEDSVGCTGTEKGNESLLPTLFGRPDCSLMAEPTLVFLALVQLDDKVGPKQTAGSKRRAITERSTNVPSKRLKRKTSIEASGP